MRRSCSRALLLFAILGLSWYGPATPPARAERCFGETSQCIAAPFLAYWEAHGGLPINGLPLTGAQVETLEDGKPRVVQWFERVRMELHPENAPGETILLGQFGRIIHPADPPVGPLPGHTHFRETGHNVPPDFMAFWAGNGGLAQFGFPLSEVFRETLEDGRSYEVQYFERARFERHPENRPPNTIQLGQFGRRILASRPGGPPAGWGRALPAFDGGPTYGDPQGRFATRYPQGWRGFTTPEGIAYFEPADRAAGSVVALTPVDEGATLEIVDEVIEGQLQRTRGYVALSKEPVTVGPDRAWFRTYLWTNDSGQPELFVRVYFVARGHIYQFNGSSLTEDADAFRPLFERIAGSIVVSGR
jgi:hypothetical protein